MQPRILGCLVAVVSTGCRDSGPSVWRKACVHSETLGPAAQFDVERCVQDYEKLPREVADDLARCTTRLESADDDGKKIRACANAQTRAWLDKVPDTYAITQAVHEAIDAHRMQHGTLPATLADLAAPPQLADAWGNALRFEARGKEYVLCSAGDDGAFDTEDDLCPQATLEFQF